MADGATASARRPWQPAVLLLRPQGHLASRVNLAEAAGEEGSCSRSGQQHPAGKTSGDGGLSPLAAYQPGDAVPSMFSPGLGFQIPARSEVLSSPPGGSLSKVARSQGRLCMQVVTSFPPLLPQACRFLGTPLRAGKGCEKRERLEPPPGVATEQQAGRE